ncbi:MAG TPA: P-loop NTPase fold protein [Ignavibacteria bacterium]|nr:P-loop NTPase fold protein [Ignavibacteriaceae bacterium]HRK00976.1 P-loop NTPase fold protein [Ignavibacteria bacterium]
MWSDNETSEDLLGFKVHANLLIDVINDDTVLPVTIGVFGDWGSGKSSILKIVKESMEKLEEDVLVLYFNGWTFEGYDDAKAALLESIIKGFEENTKIRSKIKTQAKKLLKKVDWMRVVGFGFKKIVIPAASSYLTGGFSLVPQLAQGLSDLKGKELSDKIKSGETEELLNSILKDKVEDENPMVVRSFRKDFDELIDKSKIKKLIVIIDDLDRCTPDRIIENLEAIKLFLNVDKTAFIIGADPRIVRHAIEYRFKPRVENPISESSNNRIVEDYLEKLIQIPYNLPKLSDSEVETYISLLICKRELIQETFEKVITRFDSFRSGNKYSVFGFSDIKDILSSEEQTALTNSLVNIPAMSSIICQSLYGNPRQIKRFLNTFTLRKRLAAVANIKDFKDDILAKLMILEYSEPVLFKQIFDWQILQNGIPKEISQIEKICDGRSFTEITEALKKDDLEKWSNEKVIKWIKVEPSLSGIDLRDYYWLSRDKISSSIPGASLVPPIVKSIFAELEEDLSASIIKDIINNKVLTLNDSELSKFLEYSVMKLRANCSEKKYYDIFHFLIEENISNSIVYYKEVLSNIDLNTIPASVGVRLKKLSEIPELSDFLSKLFEDNNSEVSKAFKSEDL